MDQGAHSKKGNIICSRVPGTQIEIHSSMQLTPWGAVIPRCSGRYCEALDSGPWGLLVSFATICFFLWASAHLPVPLLCHKVLLVSFLAEVAPWWQLPPVAHLQRWPRSTSYKYISWVRDWGNQPPSIQRCHIVEFYLLHSVIHLHSLLY